MKSFISSFIVCIFSPKVSPTCEIIICRLRTVGACSTRFKLWDKVHQASRSSLRSVNFITARYSHRSKAFLPGYRLPIYPPGISCGLASKASNCYHIHSSLHAKSFLLSSSTHSQALTKSVRLFSKRSNPSAAALGSPSDFEILDKVFGSKGSKMTNNQSAKRTSAHNKSAMDAKSISKNGGSRSGQAPTENSKRMKSGVARLSKDPNTVVALHPQNNPLLTLDICLRKADAPTGLLTKSMARDQNEAASKVLDRIRMLYAPERAKGSKGRRLQREDILNDCPKITVMGIELSSELSESPSFPIQGQEAKSDLENNVSCDTLVELDTELPNHIFWRHARHIKLGGEELTIKYNIPTITSIEVPNKCLVGLPLMCTNIEAVFVQNEELHYEWCICEPDVQNHQDILLKKASEKDSDHVRVLSTEPVFIPTEDLIGKRILLRVSPNKSGLWTQVEISPVQEPPPAMARWKQTTEYITSPAFRVVTYNILHDDFCTSKYSKTRIYPFASEEVLDIENRMVRILQELLMYHSDLICLQECGQRLFKRFLEPAMGACGYGAYYKNKIGNAQEGCVLFYRKARFELVEPETFALNWDTLGRDHPELASRLDAHAELKEALQRVTSIGVVLLLREIATGQEVVLGSTHLFYHANACHIRILQAYMLLHRLYQMATAGIKEAELAEGRGRRRSVVLCGDFNFTHCTGAYRLVTTGQVEATHHSWEKGRLFWWGCDRQLGCSEEELLALNPNTPAAAVDAGDRTDAQSGPEKVAPAEDNSQEKGEASKPSGAAKSPLEVFFKDDLHTPLALIDAYDRTDPAMQWTNYTLTFREVIDYVFFSSDSIDVLQTVPIPPEFELSENHALPNAKYPSDHLALIADLILKQL
ncbi:unnamed protein product [Phytomonas sp. EM1]|nr:unnamed protein product [Phytomonas sp. EM1]|eukprot:CCW60623.1 unnamed protein product [Phytomonas sp. isolate EM1]